MFDSIRSADLLRLALVGDAAASGACGLAMAAGAGVLAAPLGLPHALLLGCGLFLLAYALGVAVVATRPRIPLAAARAIVALNLLWAIESVALPLAGWLQPTALGHAFVAAQALVVLGFALAQLVGLRRRRSLAA